MIQLLSCRVQIGYAEVEEQSTLTVYSKRIITVLRQFWGIIQTGTIRPSDEAVQSLPSRTFVV